MMIDPRGPRFGALITMVVFAVVLITSNAWLLAVQGLFFAIGAGLGVPRSPYGLLYRWLIRPRLGPPAELEDARPPQFAQVVGLGFAVVGVLGFATGLTAVGLVATAAALAAAFLNAAFGFCLGCELYLTYRRLTTTKGVPA